MPLTGVNTRPGEKPPVMPKLANQDNSAGARAFGTFWVKTVDWGFATMNTAYMRHYIDPSCKDCTADANNIDRAARQHDRFVGGRITVLGVRTNMSGPVVPRADGTALVRFRLTVLRVFDRHGKQIGRYPGYRQATFQVSVVWEIDHWDVDDLGGYQ